MRLLSVSAGQIVIKDTNGATRFDTDDGLFHITNQLSGSVGVANVTGGGGSGLRDLTSTVSLGVCHADCTHVIGALKFTLNNYAAGMAFDRWHTFLGGSALWVMDGEPGFGGAIGDNSGFGIRQMSFYTFRVTGGEVFLDLRLHIANTTFSYTIISHTIEFKIKTGLFT